MGMDASVPVKKTQQPRGPLRRVSSVDAMAVREALVSASQLLEPEDRTQRQLFKTFMPELFVLRSKGISFNQLTALLNESGFKMKCSTVRAYYSEMILETGM
jgi:hypothetical protein